MAHIAELIGVTPAEVLGTCSFYEMFKREPVGEYLVNVCTNISCMLLGGEELLHHLEDRLGIKAGSTTPDGTFTIEDVECIAACTEAPCLQVNYRYFYKVTPDDADALIDDLRHGRRAHEVPEARRPRPHPPAAAARPARRQRGARRVPRSPLARTPADARRRPRDDHHRRQADRHHPLRPRGRAHARPLPRHRRLRGPEGGAGQGPHGGRRRGQGREPARPRRRRLPGRHQVGLLPARCVAALPRGERRRVRAGHLQGPAPHGEGPAPAHRGRAHRLLRHRR